MKAAPCPFRNVGVVSQKICPRSSTVRGMSGGYCGWADLQKSKISVHTVWLGVLSWKCSAPEMETKLKDVDLRFSQHVVVCAPLSCCFSNEISRRCWASVKSHWLEEDTDSVAVRCNFLWMRASAKWLKIQTSLFPGGCFVLYHVLLTESEAFLRSLPQLAYRGSNSPSPTFFTPWNSALYQFLFISSPP